MNSNNYIDWFRASSPYINDYRGKTFVVYLPGEAISHDNFSTIIQDLALLNSLGVRLVIVHGARPQIDERLGPGNNTWQDEFGARVTDLQTLPAILQAIGETRFYVESALSMGLPNSPMHGADISVLSGNFVVGMPRGVINGVDFQLSGKVRKIASKNLTLALDSDAMVVVSPLGFSLTGEIFNIPATEVASEIAIALAADKLITFINEDGLLDLNGDLIRQLAVSDCQDLINSGAITEEDAVSALRCAFRVCRKGVARAQIVSYCESGALLEELFTLDGRGTLVHSDRYEFVRPATIDDVGGILSLIEPLEAQGILVRRSRELLEREIDQFFVLELDGSIVGCAGLYGFSDSDFAELACVATHPDYQSRGFARRLLVDLEHQARKLGYRKLFVLTTQTAHWFMEQGFKPADISELPSQKQLAYNYQRKSKIFIKTLQY
ncbi:amino-acid N-acetyltransferase [Sessilibacter sp. MAH1]